jgi:hypothetical protein
MLDFSRFEILTFDCYGTLIDWESGILSALRPILSAHGKTIDDAGLLKLYGDFEQRSEQGAFRPYRKVLESVVRQLREQNLNCSPHKKSDPYPTLSPPGNPGLTPSPLSISFRPAIASPSCQTSTITYSPPRGPNSKLISTRSLPRSKPWPTNPP